MCEHLLSIRPPTPECVCMHSFAPRVCWTCECMCTYLFSFRVCVSMCLLCVLIIFNWVFVCESVSVCRCACVYDYTVYVVAILNRVPMDDLQE